MSDNKKSIEFLKSKAYKYFFKLNEIMTVDASDPKLDEYIRNSQPIVIKNTHLVESALHKWNFDYLGRNLANTVHHVFKSPNNRFLYWDDKNLANIKNFKPPTESLRIKFQEFLDLLKNPGDHRYYLQQTLNDTVGKEIIHDYTQFNWSWVTERQKNAKWGELTSNLLLIGQPGNITPCHYDEQENFFAQVHGYKRCLLFHPKMYPSVYTYPVYHPFDRQSMVDFANPDFEKFPRLNELEGYEVIVGPGDVLYIPTYWFHQIESLDYEDNITTSVNFWYRARSVHSEEIIFPLRPDQKIAMTRNIEKLVLQGLQDPAELPEFFRNLTLGRYTNM